MNTKSDAELMRLVLEKHRPALEELYDRYAKLVYAFALKATKEQISARSIVQAVFIRLWTTENGYNPDKGQFVNWLLMVTRNLTIDHLRQQKRERVYTNIDAKRWEQIPDIRTTNPDEAVFRKSFREQVKNAYRYLSNSQIELIQSLYWEGYSLSEIAQKRKEPIGTIKSRLHQTLKILRNSLEMEE